MYGSSGDETTTEPVHILEQDLESSIAWTKLTVPKQSNSYLKRSRLIEAIFTVIDRRLILVRAPAGYGKTSLLIDLACDPDLQVCWYTLDREDSDLSVFLNCLLASIARRFPSFGNRSAQLLKHLEGEGQVHTQMRAFVTTLVDEMLSTVPEYFYLVLDDYHTLQESCYVHELIRLLIEFMPEHCHLIISSRAVPPLPLIRLVARQQMAAIGVDELRFTEQEIGQLAQVKLGRTPSLDLVRFLLQQTDGWITAILLSADRGWDNLLGNGIDSVAGLTEIDIYDYLMNEVFGYQTEETKRFLLHTAILSEITPSLCRELVGGECTEILQGLEKQSLFISRVEETGVETTYRYHPLFRDFLLSRLRAQPESLYQHLNARAAGFFAGRQNWPAAIRHYLSAGGFAEVKQIILSRFDKLRLAGNRESLARWIDDLPPEHNSLDLQLKRASLAADLGQTDTALRLYTNAIVVYQSHGHPAGLAFALIERSYALSRNGSYGESIEDCLEALSLIAGEEGMDSLRGCAYRYLGMFYGETDEPEKGLHFLTLAHESWERSRESPSRMAALAQTTGMACEKQNRFVAAIKEYKTALDIWTHLCDNGGIAEALNGIGVCRHRLGEYQSALDLLHDALLRSQAGGLARVEAYVLASLGDLYHDLGQFSLALTYYDLGIQKAIDTDETYLKAYVSAMRVDVLHLTGQIERAQREGDQLLSEGGLYRLAEARCRLALSSTFLTQRNTARARQEIESALALSGGNTDIHFRGQLRLAQVTAFEGRLQETSKHLRAAFEMAAEAELGQPLAVESLHHLQTLQLAMREHPSDEIGRWIASAGELEHVRRYLATENRPGDSGDYHPDLQVQSLGGSMVLKGNDLVPWRTTQAKELFFYLLTHPHGQTKEQIGAAIWPEHSPAKLFSIFRSSMFRVRKALFSDVISLEENQYRVNPQIRVRYDAQIFEQAISMGDIANNPVQKAHHYRQAIDLYKGEFLADLYGDWILAPRETLRMRYLKALTFLAEFRLKRKDYPQAIKRARQILEADQYHETAHYLLVQAYVRSGQRPQAKRIYDQCCRMLTEFGLSPQRSWEDLS